ncbi:MAG: transposase [Pseudomonadota bacterium]
MLLPNVSIHLVQRGHNRHACFFFPEDYRYYLDWLDVHARESGCAVHAFVLMTNHVHLLVTGALAGSVSDMMKGQAQRYTQHINRKYLRTGTLWEGRYHSCIAQNEQYVLACQRYIELNPVRAGMVHHPSQYVWSSYADHAYGSTTALLTKHEQYLALGADDAERTAAYQGLCDQALTPEQLKAIRHATHGNFALGSIGFVEEMARVLGRRVSPGVSGQPRR